MRIVGSSSGWIQNKTEQMENNVVILSGSRLGAENETQKKKQLSIKKKKKQISKPLLTNNKS